MTIAAAYLTSEGTVLGTDSTTTIAVDAGVAQLFNHAQKVFAVGPEERPMYGICTWGAGMVSTVTHRSIAARLSHRILMTPGNVIDAVNRLVEVVDEVRNPVISTVPFFGYFLCGTNHETHIPECYEITFPENQNASIRSLPVGRASFRGAPEFFTRIFRGYDQRLPSTLLAALQASVPGLPSNFQDLFQQAFQSVTRGLTAAGYPNPPIREAIDFIHMYLNATIKANKFRYGVPVCGGPIEIGVVTSDRPFRWVQHKKFDTAIVEQEVGLND